VNDNTGPGKTDSPTAAGGFLGMIWMIWRSMGSPYALIAVAALLLVSFSTLFYLDGKLNQNEQTLNDLTVNAERILGADEAATASVRLAAGLRSKHYVIGYDGLVTTKKTLLKMSVDLFDNETLSATFAKLTETQKSIEEVEREAIALIQGEAWEEALGLVVGKAFKHEKRIYQGELSKMLRELIVGSERLTLETKKLRTAYQAAVLGSFLLLALLGFAYLQRIRGNLAREVDLRENLKVSNESLEQRVQRLLQTESKLYEVQESLDRQMKIYRNLFELGQTFLSTRTIDDAFQLSVENSNEKLGYDRCVIFARDAESGAYAPRSYAGYWEEDEEQAIQDLRFSPAAFPVSRFAEGDEALVLEFEDGDPSDEKADFGRALLVDEFIVMKITGPDPEHPHAFITVGNSKEQFEYSTRVKLKGDDIVSVGNLSSMVSSVVSTLVYQGEVEEERRLLEVRVEERTRDLAESEARIRAVMDNVADGIITITADGTIESVNRATEGIFGFAPSELVGKNVKLLMPADTARVHDQYLAHYRDTGEAKIIGRGVREVVGLHRDGREFPMDLSVGEVAMADLKLFVGAIRDTTERKEAERKLKDAFAVITSSIQYASRIQRSILPDMSVIDDIVADCFVLWEPRDVVGGDVYWCDVWGDGVLLILGDCTGHGVPGAFVTLLATGALERAKSEVPEGDVAGLVQRMHQFVQITLGQHVTSGESDDGLELGACYLSAGADEMTFVGARFDLLLNRSQGVEIIRGTRKGIGYCGIPSTQEYKTQKVPLGEGAAFYMVSDGIIDQVGGEKRRGFGRKRLIALLNELYGLPAAEQKERLHAAVVKHQGKETRRDDVSAVGFMT
jgi:PAS domain S-box-containing protein